MARTFPGWETRNELEFVRSRGLGGGEEGGGGGGVLARGGGVLSSEETRAGEGCHSQRPA